VALPSHIQLQIVSADRSLVSEQVEEVEIPGVDGYFGVLPGHTPLLALLGAGELWYRQGPEKQYLAIAFGFAEIQPDRVTILAQIAERAEEIDVARAQASRDRSEARLAQATTEVDRERAELALRRAELRLRVAQRARRGARAETAA
jgi:F-type H+-transporting ATPase subunit epsilon